MAGRALTARFMPRQPRGNGTPPDMITLNGRITYRPPRAPPQKSGIRRKSLLRHRKCSALNITTSVAEYEEGRNGTSRRRNKAPPFAALVGVNYCLEIAMLYSSRRDDDFFTSIAAGIFCWKCHRCKSVLIVTGAGPTARRRRPHWLPTNSSSSRCKLGSQFPSTSSNCSDVLFIITHAHVGLSAAYDERLRYYFLCR